MGRVVNMAVVNINSEFLHVVSDNDKTATRKLVFDGLIAGLKIEEQITALLIKINKSDGVDIKATDVGEEKLFLPDGTQIAAKAFFPDEKPLRKADLIDKYQIAAESNVNPFLNTIHVDDAAVFTVPEIGLLSDKIKSERNKVAEAGKPAEQTTGDKATEEKLDTVVEKEAGNNSLLWGLGVAVVGAIGAGALELGGWVIALVALVGGGAAAFIANENYKSGNPEKTEEGEKHGEDVIKKRGKDITPEKGKGAPETATPTAAKTKNTIVKNIKDGVANSFVMRGGEIVTSGHVKENDILVEGIYNVDEKNFVVSSIVSYDDKLKKVSAPKDKVNNPPIILAVSDNNSIDIAGDSNKLSIDKIIDIGFTSKYAAQAKAAQKFYEEKKIANEKAHNVEKNESSNLKSSPEAKILKLVSANNSDEPDKKFLTFEYTTGGADDKSHTYLINGFLVSKKSVYGSYGANTQVDLVNLQVTSMSEIKDGTKIAMEGVTPLIEDIFPKNLVDANIEASAKYGYMMSMNSLAKEQLQKVSNEHVQIGMKEKKDAANLLKENPVLTLIDNTDPQIFEFRLDTSDAKDNKRSFKVYGQVNGDNISFKKAVEDGVENAPEIPLAGTVVGAKVPTFVGNDESQNKVEINSKLLKDKIVSKMYLHLASADLGGNGYASLVNKGEYTTLPTPSANEPNYIVPMVASSGGGITHT